MNRRSRSGCINCRRAKVKCDEQMPFCGTCTRRNKECYGYPAKQLIRQPPLKWTTTHHKYDNPPRKKRRPSSSASLESSFSAVLSSDEKIYTAHDANLHKKRHVSIPGEEESVVSDQLVFGKNAEVRISDVYVKEVGNDTLIGTQAFLLTSTDIIVHRASPTPWHAPSISRSLSPFFNANITPDLAQGISMYFSRHPEELVIGSEPSFVQEMNTYVLGVLYSDVESVGDSLSAIGQTYLHNQGSQPSLALALSSRQKTLSRIRKDGRLKIEQAISMILALISMELIDKDYRPSESSYEALHSAASAMIYHFLSRSPTLVLSSTTKYMVRALAREDIIMALLYQKRPLIPTSLWLDEACQTHADRFMGFTMTLIPLLEDLAMLAKDNQRVHYARRSSTNMQHPGCNNPIEDTPYSPSLILSQATSLRIRILSWHPPLIDSFSGPASRKFLLHASMYRLGALLYLHRLVNPHGCSKFEEDQALILAYDIIAHLSTEARDNRLALFPIFLATCEFEKLEDRSMAVDIFDAIYGSRNTFSTLVTKTFVIKRVWKARDAGRDWGWMGLVQKWRGECVPI